MNNSDRVGFSELISGVYAFYRAECSPFAVDVWWQTMQGYDLAAVRDALGRHAMNPDTGQFLPKPADVVRMIQGTTVDSSMLAWSKVDRAVRCVGPYQSVCFDDPLINRVIADMGGWIDFGNCDEREWPFRAKEFQTRYRGYKGTGSAPEFPRRLVGIAEAECARGGHALPDPVLIGDVERALLVHKRGGEQPTVGVQALSQVLARMRELPKPDEEG